LFHPVDRAAGRSGVEQGHRGELELLGRCGITPAQALNAATAAPARAFNLADRGRTAPGQRADLMLVSGDPLTDITATRAIERIRYGFDPTKAS
jgi:imidazolonepropionase-like amidohydrolase